MAIDARGPEAVLPHAGHALFVREVVRRDGQSISCRGSIDAHSPYVQDGRCDSYLALELAAQTAALLPATGGDASPGKRLGYLVSLRDIEIETDTFAAGESLTASVELVAIVKPLHVFQVQVHDGLGDRVLSGKVSTYNLGVDPGGTQASHPWATAP